MSGSQNNTARPDALTLAGFFAAAFLGGANVVAVRFSNQTLPPFYGAALRFLLASVLLLAYMIVHGIPVPSRDEWRGTIGYGLFGFAGFYALAYWALVSLSSAVGAIVLASGPLVTLIIASLQRVERFTARGALGSVVALAGIAVMVGTPSEVVVPVAPLVAIVFAAISTAEAAVLIKRLPTGHPVSTNGFAMLLGSLVLFATSAVAGETWTVPSGGVMLATLGFLVLLGSVGLFIIYFATLKRWTASGMSYIFVLMPIVAAALGVWLLDEPITVGIVIGGLLIIAGVYVGALSGHGASSWSHRVDRHIAGSR